MIVDSNTPSEYAPYPFDPPDFEYLHFWWGLTNGQRISAMLGARELAVGLVRGQLRGVYPELSERELNLKVLEKLERRGKRVIPRFDLLP